jgi:DNA-binding response OmpR family regulator
MPQQDRQSILVVGSDPEASENLAAALGREAWRAVIASSALEGSQKLAELDPVLVIVDVRLPDGSGLSLLRQASSRPRTGIIVTSDAADEVDRIVALEMGADDYILKPFSTREMVARVRALSRRLGALAGPAAAIRPPSTGPVEMAGVTLDPDRFRLILRNGSTVRLTHSEGGLLRLLLNSPEQPVRRETVAASVLGYRTLLPGQSGVDQLTSLLRRKLAEASGGAIQLVAVRGRGYRLLG